jgi:hypothetical protein
MAPYPRKLSSYSPSREPEISFGLIWLRARVIVGSCEYGNEPSYSMKDGDFWSGQQALKTFSVELVYKGQ